LVGAGPGSFDLITLRGLNALRSADVILFDALVEPDFLDHIKPEAIVHDVGKRKGANGKSQEDINVLILEMALKHGHVVRLKGGDPFVFGRGMEEWQHLAQFGIEVEYIPGVSSCISVPGLAGIPVTHRGSSESFWVITGTTRDGSLSPDVRLAAQTKATVVILMGVSKLSEIVEIFKANGHHDLPVAIIQNGSLPFSKCVVGTVKNIKDKTSKIGIESPAVIVLGSVVKQYSEKQILTSIEKNAVQLNGYE